MRNFSTSLSLVLLIGANAYAGSATSTIEASKSSALRVIVTAVNVDCTWPPGRWLLQFDVLGSDGNPVTYSLGGTPTGDLAISGNQLVIGPNGVAPPNCGNQEPLTVNATQP